MADADLDVLLINNLADLDAAARRIRFALEPTIHKAMDEAIKEFREEVGWDGDEENNWDKYECWLAPTDWRKPADGSGDSHKCQFELDYGLGDDGPGEEGADAFVLTRLLGIADGRLGFRWSRNDVKKRAWRRLVGEQSSEVGALRAKGFEYEEGEGSFYLPVQVLQAELAEAVQDETPRNALGPLREKLRALIEAKPEFDALLRATASIE